MLNKIVAVYLVSVWTIIPFYAGNDPVLESTVNSWLQSSGSLRFTENKGQMADLQDGNSGKCVTDNKLLFKVNGDGVDIYITTWGLSYVFAKIEKSVIPQLRNSAPLPGRSLQNQERTQIQYCRADMELAGAVIKKENIIQEQESEDRTDYYLPHCPDGVLNVHSYKKITIKNIYPGIDWVLYQKNQDPGMEKGKAFMNSNEDKGKEANKEDLKNTGGLEYDFIVHPGADPALIQLRYRWTDKPKLQRDGSVKITTPMGDMMEGIPVSYQADDHRTIDTHFSIQGNKLVFKIGKYNPGMNLIIDPTLQWSTYFGGSVTNGGEDINSISADAANVWLTGYSLNTGFPAGDTLNPRGGAYFQGKVIGSSDVIILQFSTCGKLIWATYYGGSSMDQGNSISSDGTNIWVTGETQSTNFPTKNLGTAYNQPTIGGVFNAFVLQFQVSTGSRTWATYYGGSIIDFGYSINSDGSSVWITGETQSTNFPVKTLGTAYNQAAKGSGDAFVLQFSCATGSLTWASYYGGSGSDIGYSIQSDKSNVWVTGLTTSTDFPLHPLGGAYNQATLGGTGATNVFILEFSCVTSTPIWATYYGGSGGGGVFFGDEGRSISSDGVNVWLTGVSFSTDFPTKNPATGQYFNGINSNPGNAGGTAFILQFNCANSSLVWGTFYGGSKSDIGYSIQSDGSNVWVCGATSSTDFPTQASVPTCGFFQAALGNGTHQDVFILQFNTSGIRQWATYFGVDGENDGSYISSNGTSVFVAGDAQGPAASGTSYKLQSLAGAYYNTTLGTNETSILAKFNISCASPVITVSPNTAICNGNSTLLGASGGIDYTWSPAAGLSSANGSSVTASPAVSVTYTVTGISTAGCVSQTATVTVSVTDISVSVHSTNTCHGKKEGTLLASAISSGSIISYSWSNHASGAGLSGLDTGQYTITVTDAGGCTATASASIVFFQNSLVSAGPDAAIVKGEKVQLTASGGINYLWTPGFSLNDSTISNPIADPFMTTLYQVTITDIDHCETIDSVLITVKEASECNALSIYIPTAFSPNGDGKNDEFLVHGATCMNQLHLQVFDRWGELVFETTNPAAGWDGTYNSKPMDTGVFVYYLAGTLLNGQSVNKKGNVTLLR